MGVIGDDAETASSSRPLRWSTGPAALDRYELACPHVLPEWLGLGCCSTRTREAVANKSRCPPSLQLSHLYYLSVSASYSPPPSPSCHPTVQPYPAPIIFPPSRMPPHVVSDSQSAACPPFLTFPTSRCRPRLLRNPSGQPASGCLHFAFAGLCSRAAEIS
ncbi:hypothetical protein EJ06DRAFT_259494 [Trichodelitschia bisporula]|uniref:Uncharacterized protein n=1 Tax=Trichodelitschia bisporula TaxID=703511 RepID=A0A6G1HIW0_9PEZI|nr:hypothetical protein EJ06DRAFT_259494 [Trichodelitschia bisporula]